MAESVQVQSNTKGGTDLFVFDPQQLVLEAFQRDARAFAKKHGTDGRFRTLDDGRLQFRFVAPVDSSAVMKEFEPWYAAKCQPLYDGAAESERRRTRQKRAREEMKAAQDQPDTPDDAPEPRKRRATDKAAKDSRKALPAKDSQAAKPLFTLRERWTPCRFTSCCEASVRRPATRIPIAACPS